VTSNGVTSNTFCSLHAHPPLGQLQYLGLPHVDLQAVAQQFAFDTLFVLAALRQMVGAASEK